MRGRRWNEAQTLQFVKIYRKHESLWNPDHPEYQQKDLKSKAYADVANEFEAATSISLSIPEVKIKINNLRTTYYQQVNKILQKSTPDEMYEPTVVWFHEMDKCLKRISAYRRSSRDAEEAEDEFPSPVWHNLDNTEETHTDPPTRNEEEEEQNYSSFVELSIKEEGSHSTPLFKKRRKRTLKMENAAYMEQSSNHSEMREDEFDIYGKYIASQLRSMELKNALEAQLEIQTVISKARMADISQS